MGPKLADHVVVVTGASSGIGRATVERLAERGATVVAISRRAAPLEDLAGRYPGGQDGKRGEVIARSVDVTDAAALQRVTEEVVGEYGRIDAWVNNAAVSQYGRFEEVPLDEWRRVVETNLFGYVHGARAVIPYFREQGHGVLVNVGSMLSKVASPLQSAYVVSKHAIAGLSDSLRQELRDAEGIAVCTVLPGPIDTPLFQQAANRTGYHIQAPDPTVDARRVAMSIERSIRHPRREVAVGAATTRPALFGHRLAPGLTERLAGPIAEATHLTDEPAPPTAGNVFEPAKGSGDISGGWKPATVHQRGRAALVILAAGTVAAAVWRSRTAHG